MVRSLLFSCLLAVSSLAQANDTYQLSTVMAHRSLGALKVIHDGTRFQVQDEHGSHSVKPYDIDSVLKNIPAHKLHKFDKNAYCEVRKLSDGSYKLLSHVRGEGGGPMTGWAAYIGTQVVGYSAFGVACFFDPHLVIHTMEAHEAIQVSAQAAGYLGTISPTP